MSKIIGVDIGGTHVRAGLVDDSGSVLAFEMIPTGDLIKQGAFVEEFVCFLAEFMSKHQCMGLSVGFPSTIDKNRKVLLSTPNIPGIDGVPIVDILEKRLNCHVWLDKDVNHLLVYDINKLNLSSDKIILGFYIGTGLGNAIFLNGELLHGAHGAASELGIYRLRG